MIESNVIYITTKGKSVHPKFTARMIEDEINVSDVTDLYLSREDKKLVLFTKKGNFQIKYDTIERAEKEVNNLKTYINDCKNGES